MIAKLDHEWSLGETQLRVGYASFDDFQDEFEYEVDFDRSTPRFTGDLEVRDTNDTEMFANLEHEFELSENLDFAIGGFIQDKDRDTLATGGKTIAEIRSDAYYGDAVFVRLSTHRGQSAIVVEAFPERDKQEREEQDRRMRAGTPDQHHQERAER